jgi:disulfide bond formation protein DsbB
VTDFTYIAFESAASTNSATGATRCDPERGPVEGRDYIQGESRVNRDFVPALPGGPARPNILRMPLLSALAASPRSLTLASILLAAGILGAALTFEHAWGYAPCHLCLQQREPWWGLIGLGLVLLYLPFLWQRAPGRMFIGLFAIGVALALYNAYLGSYHSGIEWKWWPGPPSCTGTAAPLGTSFDGLIAANVIRCDEAAWRDPVVGLSMAGYNVLASLAAAAMMGLGGWRLFQMARVMNLLQPGLRSTSKGSKR